MQADTRCASTYKLTSTVLQRSQRDYLLFWGKQTTTIISSIISPSQFNWISVTLNQQNRRAREDTDPDLARTQGSEGPPVISAAENTFAQSALAVPSVCTMRHASDTRLHRYLINTSIWQSLSAWASPKAWFCCGQRPGSLEGEAMPWWWHRSITRRGQHQIHTVCTLQAPDKDEPPPVAFGVHRLPQIYYLGISSQTPFVTSGKLAFHKWDPGRAEYSAGSLS